MVETSDIIKAALVEEKKQQEQDQTAETVVNKKPKMADIKNVLLEFDLVRVLNDNSQSKLVFIQAAKKNETDATKRDAVVILEKPHFGSDEIKSYLSVDNELEIDFINDIYTKLTVFPSKPYNNVQVQLIYPATDKHISKYTMQEMYFVDETADDWRNITEPHVNSSALNIQWVYNILEHKTESERIVYEDADPSSGFILLPDMKWDSRVTENLYLLGICHRRGLRCLRDLDASHVGLLEGIREHGLATIESKYDVRRSQVRVYLHYLPSFYHLHVHFSHIRNQALGIPDRNYLLVNVIENLKSDSHYFKKATLEITVKRNEALYDLYKHKIE